MSNTRAELLTQFEENHDRAITAENMQNFINSAVLTEDLAGYSGFSGFSGFNGVFPWQDDGTTLVINRNILCNDLRAVTAGFGANIGSGSTSTFDDHGTLKLLGYGLVSTPQKGQIAYNYIDNYLVYYDGANWIQVAAVN